MQTLRETLEAIAEDAPETLPERYEGDNLDDAEKWGVEWQHYHIGEVAREALAAVKEDQPQGFRGMAGTHGLTLHEHGDGQARIDALSGFVDDQEDEKL